MEYHTGKFSTGQSLWSGHPIDISLTRTDNFFTHTHIHTLGEKMKKFRKGEKNAGIAMKSIEDRGETQREKVPGLKG